MANPVDRNKPLAINPLKVNAGAGSILALLGLARSLPLEHGVRGCAAFTKLFFMRHFREPIALQTTAIEEAAAILGGDGNLVEGLDTVIRRNRPEIVGIVTTTLSQFQGTDLVRAVGAFRRQFPEHAGVCVLPVVATEGLEGLEAGYARAVETLVDTLVPLRLPPPHEPERIPRVNVLAPSMLTPSDVESLKEWVRAFGLYPVVVPDLSDSLGGRLLEDGFSPLTFGGASRADIERMGQALATIVIGSSLERAADTLQERTGVPTYRLRSLMGLEACDEMTSVLQVISQKPVPDALIQQRAQLLDAMVDCQFYTGGMSVALAGEPDHLGMLYPFFEGVGVRIAAMVTPARGPGLRNADAVHWAVGDLDDLEQEARARSVDLMVTNSHGVAIANRLGIPLLRAGFPQHDVLGAHAKTWVGYAGSRQVLFDVGNLLLQARRPASPYTSIYDESDDARAASSADREM